MGNNNSSVSSEENIRSNNHNQIGGNRNGNRNRNRKSDIDLSFLYSTEQKQQINNNKKSDIDLFFIFDRRTISSWR